MNKLAKQLASLFRSALKKLPNVGALVMLLGLQTQIATGQSINSVIGVWTTESLTEIKIENCASGLCGSIVKVSIPKSLREQYTNEIAAMQGNILDGLNKDPALRNRPLLGLEVLYMQTEFVKGRLNGMIYNAEDGNTYEGFLEVIDQNKLRLSGCVFFNLICLGEDWVRTSSF